MPMHLLKHLAARVRTLRDNRLEKIGMAAVILGAAVPAFAATQTLFPAGTTLHPATNYTWSRMTTINVDSGERVPFATYSFNTIGAPAGNYTFTMNAAGFGGAINLYAVQFDPTFPQANFWDNGVVTNKAGVIARTFNLPANQTFEVVFSAETNGAQGTFSATVTGPGNLTLTQPAGLSIRVQPQSQVILWGSNALLQVYAAGPLPHRWEWFQGVAPNTNVPVAAGSPLFHTPLLTESNRYWVRVKGPNGTNLSSTAHIAITGNPNASYTNTLSAGGCKLPNGDLFATQGFEIQQAGSYAFSLTPGFNIAIYQNSFDPIQTNVNFWGAVNGFYPAGNFIAVISRAAPGGTFEGGIGGGPAIVSLTAPLPPQILTSPGDTTVLFDTPATLWVSMTCGTPFALQWYRGLPGDITQPISGANGPSYTTPPVTSNSTYWVRMTWATGTNDSGAATVTTVNGPVTRTGFIDHCSRVFDRPSGPGVLGGVSCNYDFMKFVPSASGYYTFSNFTTGTLTNRATLYAGSFLPGSPLVNLAGLTNSAAPLTAYLSAYATYYLVVSSSGPGQAGAYTTTFSGPSLVTLRPAPAFAITPTNVITSRGQPGTFHAASTLPGTGFQWFVGSFCSSRAGIVVGGASSTYVTPAWTDNQSYFWVELSSDSGYALSPPLQYWIRPEAVNDAVGASQDTVLNVPGPAVLLNDRRADSKTLSIATYTQPAHGTVVMQTGGGFTYTPQAGYHGADAFTYHVNDGVLNSVTPGVVSITVAPARTPPAAITLSPRPVAAAQATLRGLVDPGHEPTTCHFEHGPGPAYGSRTPGFLAGYALDFDGTNMSAESAGAVNLSNTSFTVEFWMRRDGSNRWDMAVNQGVSATRAGLHLGFRDNNRFTFGFWGDDLDAPPSTSDNEWHHWACVYNVTNHARAIYRDGVLVAANTSAGAYLGTGPLRFARFDQLNLRMRGGLDEVRVWNLARGAAEIAARMHGPLAGTEPGLVGHWSFDEGTGTVAADATTNANAASLIANPRWNPDRPVSGSLAGLLPGTLYHCRIVASNRLGVVPGGNITFTTPALAPAVTTLGATGVTFAAAALRGVVAPNGADTTWFFEYGPDPGYGATTPAVVRPATGAIQLNGTSQSGTAGILNLSNRSFTVEFWARRDGSNNWDMALGHGTNRNGNGLHVGFRDNNRFTFGFWGDDLDAPLALSDNAWHHWACTYDVTDNRRVIHRDGVPVATNFAASAYRTNGILHLGQMPGIGGSHFGGALDEVRVWGAARTAADIAAGLGSAVPGNTPGLLGVWRFDDGAGGTAAEASGANTAATFVNNPGWTTGPVPGVVQEVSASLGGLLPGTLYYYRLIGTNSAGATQGGVLTFTTPVVPAPQISVPTVLSGGSIGLSFAAPTGVPCTILFSTNAALPAAQWMVLGPAVESPAGSGQFHFTAPVNTNSGPGFYRVRTP